MPAYIAEITVDLLRPRTPPLTAVLYEAVAMLYLKIYDSGWEDLGDIPLAWWRVERGKAYIRLTTERRTMNEWDQFTIDPAAHATLVTCLRTMRAEGRRLSG